MGQLQKMSRFTIFSIVALALASCGGTPASSTPEEPELKPVEYIPPTGLD